MATTNYGIPTLAGSDLARDIDTLVTDALDDIDSKMVGYSQGPLASRPVSTGGTPGIAGRRYRATDTAQEFVDTGTSWVDITPATALVAYRTIAEQHAYFGEANVSASVYLPVYSGGGLALGVSPLTAGIVVPIRRIDPADYAVAGMTTNFRLRGAVSVGSTAPARTFTFGLYPVTFSGGGADTIRVVAGTVVTGSTSNCVNPSANSVQVSSPIDFTPPTAGSFVLGVAISGAIATDSFGILYWLLQVHHT